MSLNHQKFKFLIFVYHRTALPPQLPSKQIFNVLVLRKDGKMKKTTKHFFSFNAAIVTFRRKKIHFGSVCSLVRLYIKNCSRAIEKKKNLRITAR
jgi:hypothetical protein